jgi:hypothetical protein
MDFFIHKLHLENNLFHKLSHSIDFEELGKGRKGNILVNKNDINIPIVRTTTNYQKPAHIFSDFHYELVKNIKNTINTFENSQFNSQFNNQILNLDFNNAMIEIYDQDYTKMGYHSDQCLDLENNSCIALFSCYERPNELLAHHLRTLKIKNKATNEETELLLENNTFVIFSLKTNALFQHKIILENPKENPTKNPLIENNWLGITFRKSKTFVHFEDNLPYFSNGNLLEIANETQKKDFFMLKGQENNNIDFMYPNIAYTLSVSDTLLPI